MIKNHHNKFGRLALFISWQENCQCMSTVGSTQITVSLVLLRIYFWNFWIFLQWALSLPVSRAALFSPSPCSQELLQSNAEFYLWSHISPLRGSSLMTIVGMRMMLRFQVASSQLLWKLMRYYCQMCPMCKVFGNNYRCVIDLIPGWVHFYD